MHTPPNPQLSLTSMVGHIRSIFFFLPANINIYKKIVLDQFSMLNCYASACIYCITLKMLTWTYIDFWMRRIGLPPPMKILEYPQIVVEMNIHWILFFLSSQIIFHISTKNETKSILNIVLILLYSVSMMYVKKTRNNKKVCMYTLVLFCKT